MISEFKRHKLAYTFLIAGLSLGVVLYLGSWPAKTLQQLAAILIGLFYAFWGITTHLKTKEITNQVMYEYLSVAAFGVLILLLLTL